MNEIEHWLLEVQKLEKISPLQWQNFPDELKVELERLAEEEAVRRAEEFGRHGFIETSESGAVDGLIHAMSKIWMLPGEKVRLSVEEYLDSLPPAFGAEFPKLVKRIFRRVDRVTLDSVREFISTNDQPKVIQLIAPVLGTYTLQNLTESMLLDLLQRSYDDWSLQNPDEAVEELFFGLGVAGDPGSRIELPRIRAALEDRGATWCKDAIDLELELGIEDTGFHQMVLIYKRFGLLKNRDYFHFIEKPSIEEPALASVADDGAYLDDLSGSPKEEESRLTQLESESMEALSEEVTGRLENLGVETEPEDLASNETFKTASSWSPGGDGIEMDWETPGSFDMTSPAKVQSKEAGLSVDHALIDDRFAPLLNGKMREFIVKNIYFGNEVFFDRFLLEISSTDDWSRAYQMIINELYRGKIEPRSQVGDEFYHAMKKCFLNETLN